MKCSICSFGIDGSMIGTGDGTMKNGGSFAHPDCYWRQRAEELEARNSALIEAVRDLHQRAESVLATLR
jgi:hypothetical protein